MVRRLTDITNLDQMCLEIIAGKTVITIVAQSLDEMMEEFMSHTCSVTRYGNIMLILGRDGKT
jgi:hypothetical protein